MNFKQIIAAILLSIISVQINAFELSKFANLDPIKKVLSRRDVQAVTALAALSYTGWKIWNQYNDFKKSYRIPVQKLLPGQIEQEERQSFRMLPKRLGDVNYEQIQMDHQQKLEAQQNASNLNVKDLIKFKEAKFKSQNSKIPKLIKLASIQESDEELLQINSLSKKAEQNQQQSAAVEEDREKKEADEFKEFENVVVNDASMPVENIHLVNTALIYFKQANACADLGQKIKNKKSAFELMYKAIYSQDAKFDQIDFGPLSFEQLVLENFAQLNDLCDRAAKSDSKKSREIAIQAKQQLQILDDNSPWQHGKLIVKAILQNNEHVISQAKQNKEKSKIFIIWYLYSLAVQKKQAFNEGTFALVDCQKIFDFLFDGAYARISSHYNKENKSKAALGFDFKATGLFDYIYNLIGSVFGYEIPKSLLDELTLPNNKYHLLGGNILLDKNSTEESAIPKSYHFIKAEKFGTKNADDFMHHGVEFAHAQINKLHAGADDREDMRKERVPADLLKIWNELIDSLKDFARKDEFKNNAKKFGMKYISKCLKSEFFSNLNGSQGQKRNQLFEYLCAYDHLELRAGREVILNIKEINAGIKQ